MGGKIERVVSVCLDVNAKSLLRVFKFAQMKTRVKRVAVNTDRVFLDALALYKTSALDVGRPIEVELIGSEAVDLGGPRRQFFNILIEGLKQNQLLRLFEGDVNQGNLLPTVNQDAIIAGHFKVAGRIILHSILNEGPAFPSFLLQPISTWLRAI